MHTEKIIQTVNNLFAGTDERNWQKVENTMAESVLLDFTSMAGGEPSVLSSKQIVANWAGFLPGFDKTHHQVSNFNVSENNSVALVHYHGIANHFLNKDVWTVEASYDTELKNENDNWVITKHKINLIKQSGNIDLPKQAAKNIRDEK